MQYNLTCENCGETVPGGTEIRDGVCLKCQHKARGSGAYGDNRYFGPNGEDL